MAWSTAASRQLINVLNHACLSNSSYLILRSRIHVVTHDSSTTAMEKTKGAIAAFSVLGLVSIGRLLVVAMPRVPPMSAAMNPKLIVGVVSDPCAQLGATSYVPQTDKKQLPSLFLWIRLKRYGESCYLCIGTSAQSRVCGLASKDSIMER